MRAKNQSEQSVSNTQAEISEAERSEGDMGGWLGAFALGGSITAGSMAAVERFPIAGGVGMGIGGLIMAAICYYDIRHGSEEAPTEAGRNR